MSTRTRDGSLSVAAEQMRHEGRYDNAVPATVEEIRKWGEANRIRPTGNDEKDVGTVNRLRKLLQIPPFVIKDHPIGGAIPDPAQQPTPKEIETMDAEVEIIRPKRRDPKAPVERSIGGLINAMFDEIDLVREGKGDAEKIKQLSQLSVRVVDLMNVETKFRAAMASSGRAIKA